MVVMPVYDDHPVRLAMLSAGLTQQRLANLSGVNRSTLDKLLQGVTLTVHPAVADALWRYGGLEPHLLQERVQAWNDKRLVARLSPRAQAMLLLSPEDLPQFYGTFDAWWREFTPNVTAFASMVRVNRLTVLRYARGEAKRPFLPPALHRALKRTFGLSDEYLLALGRLPTRQAEVA